MLNQLKIRSNFLVYSSILLLSLVFYGGVAQAANISSVQDGDWNTKATWSNNKVPVVNKYPSDKVTINHVITRTGGITVKSSSFIDIAAGSLTLTGAFNVDNGKRVSVAAGASLSAASMNLKNSSAGVLDGAITTTGNLIFNGAFTGSPTITVGNNLTAGINNKNQFFSTLVMTVAGNMSVQNAKFHWTSGTPTVGGNFSVSGTGDVNVPDSGGLTIGGSLTVNNQTSIDGPSGTGTGGVVTWDGSTVTLSGNNKGLNRCDLPYASPFNLSTCSEESAAPVASAFAACPSDAFLIQDTVAKIYGVNLATGAYDLLENNMGTSGKINAVGFNYHDNYIYGYDYANSNIAKIGSDYQVSTLSATGLPSSGFYVGDVSVEDNSYYAYRKGSDYGLYEINLDITKANYLTAVKVIDGSALSLNIFDFAFHPTNELLYSVDSAGNLRTIDSETGASTTEGYVGVSGTFGAVYFDATGNFYISENTSGIIYRIDVSSAAPAAEIFAYGPSSGNNDGARCALAPIVPVGDGDPTVDYGDAPDPYATSLDDNGARHQMIASLYIGDILSGTDDGVTFVTGFEAASETLVRIKATGAGYINSWIDWNQNGVFDNSEQVITDQLMSEGDNNVLIDVPYDTKLGNTWMRVRYSTTTGIGPKGGVADGEVEDHEITVLDADVSINPYPSSTGWVTLAYEDLWPKKGDYDMNDVNFAYRTSVHNFGDTHVVGYTIEGELLAYGAGYHNGFAIQLDNIASNNIDVNSVVFKINDVVQIDSPLEDNGTDDAVIIITNDVKSYLSLHNESYFYRADSEDDRLKTDTPLTFSVTVTLTSPVALAVAPSTTLNPFIFATPYTYHGNSFAYQPGRSLEIHLKNKKVSSRFNTDFFGLDDDKNSNSDDVGGTTFITDNNMPWAIELPNLWDHPKERVDLIVAYPEFTGFVNSGGSEKTTWYTSDKATSGKVKSNQ